MKKKKTLKTNPVEIKYDIPAMDVKLATMTITGLSPLLMHRFSDENIKKIADKQQGKAKGARGQRNPKAEFQAALHTMSDGKYGFPAIGIKKAMVSACRYIEGMTMTVARGAFHINGKEGGLVEIKGGKPVMDTQMVRLGGPSNSADIRYRPRFDNWSATFTINYNAGVITAQQLLNLADNAGFGVGIGDFRPERNGSFGTFTVRNKRR